MKTLSVIIPVVEDYEAFDDETGEVTKLKKNRLRRFPLILKGNILYFMKQGGPGSIHRDNLTSEEVTEFKSFLNEPEAE